MINETIINQFNSGMTIKDIAKENGINRKRLSLELGKLGFVTNNKNNARNLTDECIQDIIKMYSENMSLRSIGRKKGISHAYVKEILIKNNIFIITNDDSLKDEVYNYYFKDGLSINNIKSILNISEKRIRNIFRDNKWSFRNYGRKYIFDEYKFHNIDSHAKAYWLGFLFADAYNNEEKGELELTLKREDKIHLKKFLNFMDAHDTKIKDKIANIGDKEYEASRINLNSKILCDRLHDIGCVKAKSLIVRFPDEDILSKEYQSSFIAGYFDGNGHIGIYDRGGVHIGFYSGNEDMLIDIQNILEINNDILRDTRINTRYDDTSSCQYLCNGSDNAIRLYNYCFTNLPKDIYLKRKQDIFNMLF
jgi:hypothetical protein